MKHEIADAYKKSVLLSELDLQNNDFNDNWLNGFFLNPVIEGLNIVDSNGNLEEKNIYINFSEFEMTYDAQFFPNLHKQIKNYIFNDWGIKGTIYPIYNFYISRVEDKTKRKVLFIFFSPNKATKLFDFSLVSNKDRLVQNILEMLLKSTYLENINYRVPFRADICSGKLFLSPQVTEEKDEYFANVFSFALKFKDFKLGFSLKNEHFKLDNKNIQSYDDICMINKFKYEKKEDSREYGRPFLDFRNYEKLKITKFINQLELYKNILTTLDKFEINYDKTHFSPQYLYNSFSSPQNGLKELNVYISEDEKTSFEQALTEKGVFHGLDGLLNYIKTNFNMNVNLILNPTFDILLQNKKSANLFLMYGKQYGTRYVTFTPESQDDKEKHWNNPLNPFVDKEMYKLSLSEFLKEIKNFDTYSQVKLFNFYANITKIEPIVSQGWILNTKLVFEKPQKPEAMVDKENDEQAEIEESFKIEDENTENNDTNKKKKTEKNYPAKGTISIIKKIINELNIKYSLFVHKKFQFDFVFPETDNSVDFNSIKIIQMLPKDKIKFFSVLDLKKSSIIEDKGLFNVESYRVLIGEQINELNMDFDINEEFKVSDNLVIIDNKFLIKVRDNNFMPFIILDTNNFNEPKKDPSLLANYNNFNGLDSPVPRKSSPEDNLFYPYILPALNKVINKKLKNKNSYANCLLDFNGEHGVNIFMSYGAAMDSTMTKNNRLESLELSIIEDFSIVKLDWKDYEQLLYFYLSTLTFDYLNINETSKKSLLNKLTDVILVN